MHLLPRGAGGPSRSRPRRAGPPWPAPEPAPHAAERLAADAAALALLAGLALWINLHSIHFGLDTLDEGFEYQLASRILHGQIPYRNFFTVTTPLAFYIQAALIALIGPGLIVGRVATAFVGTGITLSIYGAGRDVAGRPLALAAALLSIPWSIPYWPQPNYSWYVLLFTLGGTWAALRAGRGRGPWAVAGALFAAAVLTKQNVGVIAAAGAAVYAAWRGGRAGLRGYALGCGIPLAAFGVFLTVAGALPAFIYQTVSFATRVFPGRAAAGIPYPSVGSVMAALRHPGTGGEQALMTYLPQLILLLGVPILAVGAEGRRPWVPEGLLVWSVVGAGLSIAYPRSDFVHIDYALPTAFLGLAWLLWRLCAGRPALTPLPFLVLGTLVLMSWPRGIAHGGAGSVPLGTPYGRGIRVDPGTARAVRAVVSAIDAAAPPGRPVLVLPYAAMLYYLADRPNPTPYDLDITLNMPPGGNAQVASAMAATHCPVFYQPNGGISIPFTVYGAPVLAELQAHYRLVADPGGFQEWLWRG